MTPGYLRSHIPESVMDRSGRALRNNTNLSLIAANKDYFDKSFFPETVRLWNALNVEIKNSTCVESFKKNLSKQSVPVPSHYYYGVLKFSIIHVHLRMGCSDLNDDLYRIGVSASPACACGARKENAFHHFMIVPDSMPSDKTLHAKIIALGAYH